MFKRPKKQVLVLSLFGLIVLVAVILAILVYYDAFSVGDRIINIVNPLVLAVAAQLPLFLINIILILYFIPQPSDVPGVRIKRTGLTPEQIEELLWKENNIYTRGVYESPIESIRDLVNKAKVSPRDSGSEDSNSIYKDSLKNLKKEVGRLTNLINSIEYFVDNTIENTRSLSNLKKDVEGDIKDMVINIISNQVRIAVESQSEELTKASLGSVFFSPVSKRGVDDDMDSLVRHISALYTPKEETVADLSNTAINQTVPDDDETFEVEEGLDDDQEDGSDHPEDPASDEVAITPTEATKSSGAGKGGPEASKLSVTAEQSLDQSDPEHAEGEGGNQPHPDIVAMLKACRDLRNSVDHDADNKNTYNIEMINRFEEYLRGEGFVDNLEDIGVVTVEAVAYAWQPWNKTKYDSQKKLIEEILSVGTHTWTVSFSETGKAVNPHDLRDDYFTPEFSYIIKGKINLGKDQNKISEHVTYVVSPRIKFSDRGEGRGAPEVHYKLRR